MKSVLAGLILTIIAAALFLLAMGSDDAAHVRFSQLGIPFAFVYGVVAYGLRQYRRPHHGVAMFGFIVLCLGVAFVIGVPALRYPMSTASGGRILFGGAFAEIVIGHFLPLRP